MAGYVLNRIPQSQRVFDGGVPSLWQAVGTTLSHEPQVSRFASEGSLTASVSSGDQIGFNINLSSGLPLSDSVATDGLRDDGDSFMVGFWIKSDKTIDMTYKTKLLYPVSFGSSTAVEEHEEVISITSGEWVFVQHSDRPTDPDDSYDYPIAFSIEFNTIGGGGDAVIYLSFPIIWASLDWTDNSILYNIYSKLPEFIRNQDSIATPYPWSLARFIEMCIIHQGELYKIFNDIIYSDVSQGKDESIDGTLSTLVEPSVAPRNHIYWLAQFTGTQLINPTTGVTPWSNLPPTWQGIDLLDEVESGTGLSPTDDGSSWDIIQDSDPEPAGLDEFLKWQVSTGYYGINAGSTQAIEESVKRVLSGTKSILVTTVSPWNLSVVTSIAETPDTSLSSIGDSIPTILELIEPTRPLGCVVSHSLSA